MTRRKRHIAALERRGYTCEYGYHWNGEVEGYSIRDPQNDLCWEAGISHDLQSEAWDSFLSMIGKAI